MAEPMQDPMAAEPFDVALSNLVQALVEGGATPREAVKVAEKAVSQKPMRAAAIPFESPTGVAAPNALDDPRSAALRAGEPVDFDTADIMQKMQAEQARRSLRGPQPPGPIGPDGREIEMPQGTPGEYQHPWSDPKKAALSTMQGLLMSSGMTGGPGRAVTGAIGHGVEQVGASPFAQKLAGAVGVGGAGAVAGMPSSVGSAGGSPLDQMTQQLDALIKQRAAAQAERESQVKGGPGVKPGRGKNYDAANEELRRMDEQIERLGKSLEIERYNQSPAGVLDAETKRKAFEDQKKKDEYGKPIRENLPPWLADSIPIVATGAGMAAMLALKGRSNAEYGRALKGYTDAEKIGDVPAMALRRGQLTQLENPSWANKLGTAATAGLPLEIATAELAIDAAKNPDSRAHKEAWDTITDPAKLAFILGRGALGSGVAYGVGSKFAPNQPDRSLGKAITQNNPYGGAGALVDDLGGAIAAGENLRRLRQSAPGGEALEANPPTPSVANALSQPSPTQRQLPAPAASPSPQTSLPPRADGRPPLPAGMDYDVNGLAYDIRTGHKIKQKFFRPRDDN